jgi:ZIP family zinc transporter
VGVALAWGALGSSSLVVGALLAMARSWSDRLVGLVLGFGAGALISAVSFELAVEGARAGGAVSVGVGGALGATAFYLLDGLVEKQGQDDAGSSLALGAFLDGVPEQLVLGLSLVGGSPISLGLIGAIFVSNLPEGMGSASEMLARGHSRRSILGLWVGVAVVCTLATAIGFAVGSSVTGEFEGALDGFAAGALLVMLADSMIPDARKAGRAAGLATALGFAVAAGLSAVS